MMDALRDAPRLVLEARLEPVAGSAFQPTGYPDLGAALFERPGHGQALLVDSVQAMANHLESIGWDDPKREPVAAIADLPYIAIKSAEDGSFLSSSRLEPHRLASAYIRDAAVDGAVGTQWIAEQLQLDPKRPLDWEHIYRAVYEIDPLCLLHGVFFSDKAWHGNPKVRRAITAVIEAHDVSPVVSGGVKRDDVAFKADAEGGRGAEEGYGFIPFARTEFTAAEIVLTASVDLSQIRGYGLGAEEADLLTTLALWEVSSLLANPLRPRTACDLDVAEVRVKRPEGAELPALGEVAKRLTALLKKAKFKSPGARDALWPAPKKSKKGK